MFKPTAGRLPPERLTDDCVSGAAPRDIPFKLFDGAGLFLLITPSGGKWWRFKYRFGGKEGQLSLGTYPLVSLTDARERRAELRAMLSEGINPSAARKVHREADLGRRAEPASRFALNSDGTLSLRLGHRYVTLTAAEAAELRAFLDATRDVTMKATPCP